ncbi:MAG TPA: sulfatase-like hydrolase/transferase, partial [Bacteroidales bacterium]|nr:sulfatase-like hydrolase/transferase [Bacteroidales bacterium]
MRNLELKVAAGMLLALGSCAQNKNADQEVEKPNIIYILADDLGYGDLGSYGQEMIKTPILDSMAATGIKFTQFYAGSTVCAPSRCTLMTGLHTGHAYIRGNANNVFLRPTDTTLSQVLHNTGYVTGMFGKWGLGNAGTTGDPAAKGWDAFTGYTDQVQAHYYYQDSINKIIDGRTQNIGIDSTRYSYEYVIDDALQFIRDNKNKHFFAYLPVRIPHAELIAPGKDLELYLDKKGNSIFDEVPYKGGEFKANSMPYAEYAAMITKLDGDVGRILQLLKKLKIDKNTIVLFASDNGA